MTVDVPFSFIWADNPHNHILSLDHAVTKTVVDLKPEWAKHVTKQGTLKVRLLKSQYGLQESSRLWYEHLKRIQVEDKFETNKFNPCIFTKDVGEEKITLIVYVDDIHISALKKHDIDGVVTMLNRHFKSVTCSRMNDYDYLGI